MSAVDRLAVKLTFVHSYLRNREGRIEDVAGYERRAQAWEFQDGEGRTHWGYVETTDLEGREFQFRTANGDLYVISGDLLRKARPVSGWTVPRRLLA